MADLIKISYRTVPAGSGCVYVFAIWAGGVYATYRKALHAHGTHTFIGNHKINTDISGKRYIRFDHEYDGKINVYLEDIVKYRKHTYTIDAASTDTGINKRPLHNMVIRLKSLIDKYPNHGRLVKEAMPVKERKPPVVRKAKKRC